MSSHPLTLVGDVGGTNCRLALARGNDVLKESVTNYTDAATPFVDILRTYLREQRLDVAHTCLAIAGPVVGDEVQLTNNAWRFSIAQTRRDLNLTTLAIVNDFEAIALALPHLRAEQLQQIGGAQPLADQPKVVIGAGTGYGAARAIRHSGNVIALPSEGGHVSIAPANERELALCAWLLHQQQQITREQLLSGPGLERIYRGLCHIDGEAAAGLSAADIQTRAISGDRRCADTLMMFCDWLGTAARDQALDALARGGVYIAGGIVKRFIPFLRASNFRERFENSDTMRSLLEPIPVYVITEEHPGLIGAAAHIASP